MTQTKSIATGIKDAPLGERAQLALDTINFKATKGIPAATIYAMDVPFMEQMTGHAPGDYVRDPDKVYLGFNELAGACMIDQYIPDNPLSMTERGYEGPIEKSATAGADQIVCDGILIDSPEAVVEHMERFVFPQLQRATAGLQSTEAARIVKIIANERRVQSLFGRNILKCAYEIFSIPHFRYYSYGYEFYFMAYGLYPEVIEKDFSLQADYATLINRAAARAIIDGGLPRIIRLDHDMADSRGTLVDVRSLDRLWFPHFARCIRPFLDAGIRILWHCDGNLIEMVPRLLEAGLGGFQGFQYEDGMDYPRICRMRDREGNPLLIWAGVSVTTTLPFGTKQDVRDQLRWLVEHGPGQGLFLGVSSSITPGTNRDNIRALIEGLKYYRQHGRSGDGGIRL